MTADELIAQWERKAAECEAEGMRLGDQQVGRELARDGAQYRQCAHQLRRIAPTPAATREEGDVVKPCSCHSSYQANCGHCQVASNEGMGELLAEAGFAYPSTPTAQRVAIDELVALLPGPYYMDPPDGGEVSVLEQLRRMAEDAAKWRAHTAQRVAAGDAGLAEFTEYFVRNYPGPDTVISDPTWHAPRIFRAAQRALAAPPPSGEPVAWMCVDNLRTKIEFTNLAHVAGEWLADGRLITKPLYTHPADARGVDGLRAVVEFSRLGLVTMHVDQSYFGPHMVGEGDEVMVVLTKKRAALHPEGQG